MHAKNLAAISAWAAFNSSSLIHGANSQTVFAANKYWTASKCRLQRWMRALRMFEGDLNDENTKHDPWPAIEIVVEEILLAEMLTRVWSAAMAIHDKTYECDELTAVAQTTHIGQIEARNRALRLILQSQETRPESFDRMNALRRKVERWTDMLLGQMQDVDVAVKYGFQKNRVRDFSLERQLTGEQRQQNLQSILITAMTHDLEKSSDRFPANPAYNREIASGVLACFSADRFDSTGLPKSTQMLWMEKHGTDSQLLVDHLVGMDEPTVVASDRRIVNRV